MTACTHRTKQAWQLVGGQEVRELALTLRFFQTQVLPGLLADAAELVITRSLAAGEANELSDHRRFRLSS
jgi:hypothetical protein